MTNELADQLARIFAALTILIFVFVWANSGPLEEAISAGSRTRILAIIAAMTALILVAVGIIWLPTLR